MVDINIIVKKGFYDGKKSRKVLKFQCIKALVMV